MNCNLEYLIKYISRGITPKYTENDDNSCMVLNQKCIRDFKIDYSPSRRNDITLRRIPDEKIVKKYDILINSTGNGTLGRVAQFLENDYKKITVDSHVTIVRPDKEKINPLFLGYLIKSKQKTIESFASGSTGQTELSKDSLKELELTFTDNKEQQNNIAQMLYDLDQKIEINTQINQTLEQIAQAMFKSWFIDFEPVRAKIAALAQGDDPDIAAMTALSGKSEAELQTLKTTNPERYQQLQQLAAAFPSELMEIDGVEVPRGWEFRKLSYFGKIICGKTPSKSKKDYYGDDIPFIKIPDMHKSIFITKTNDNLSIAGTNSQKNKYIPSNSICVSSIATIGLVSITSTLSQTNQQINSIILNNDYYREFLYLCFSSSNFQENLYQLSSGGSATLNMNTTTFSNVEILNPDNELIYLFNNLIGDSFEIILSNNQNINGLVETRGQLIGFLLKGKTDEQ